MKNTKENTSKSTKIEDLGIDQLRELYFEYIEYRDALSYLDKPVSVHEFYRSTRAK